MDDVPTSSGLFPEVIEAIRQAANWWFKHSSNTEAYGFSQEDWEIAMQSDVVRGAERQLRRVFSVGFRDGYAAALVNLPKAFDAAMDQLRLTSPAADVDPFETLSSQTIDDLDLSPHIRRILAREHIETTGQMMRLGWSGLIRLNGLGVASLIEIDTKCESHGLGRLPG